MFNIRITVWVYIKHVLYKVLHQVKKQDKALKLVIIHFLVVSGKNKKNQDEIRKKNFF